LDYNQNLGSNRLKFKSENNISDYHKRNNNNQTQYLSKSYNNISNNNSIYYHYKIHSLLLKKI